MRPRFSSTLGPLLFDQDQDARTLRQREVEALRVEFRRVQGRINFRRRRGWMYVGLLVFTLAAFVTVAAFMLSPSEWGAHQRTRFTQMTALLLLLGIATPLGAYFARRYDRQRERVRIARMRQSEILGRLSQLDEAGGGGRRRQRRRKHHSWAWRIAHPTPFNRPPLETMPHADLEEAADALGSQLHEEQGMRALAYAHAGITGAVAIVVAFVVTLSGPEYLGDLLGGQQWGGSAGPDPLLFWLTLIITLVVLGGFGSHRVTVLLRRARAYHDRLTSVERALWDARALLRQGQEEV